MAETTYVILKAVKGTQGEDAWTPIGEFASGGGERAAREFLNQGDNGEKFGEGTYRGVAKRAWGEPVPIQKKISFG